MESDAAGLMQRRGPAQCFLCGSERFRYLGPSSFSGPPAGEGKSPAPSNLWRCRCCGCIFNDRDYSVGEMTDYFDHTGYVMPKNEVTWARWKGGDVPAPGSPGGGRF